jgi:hypothetical protein
MYPRGYQGSPITRFPDHPIARSAAHPLPGYPTASQVIPDWRALERFSRSDHRLLLLPFCVQRRYDFDLKKWPRTPLSLRACRSCTYSAYASIVPALSAPHPRLAASIRGKLFRSVSSVFISGKGFAPLYVLCILCGEKGFGLLGFPHSPAGRFRIGAFGQTPTILYLSQNVLANKARNRPCSSSRAERNHHWPEFFATFREYSAHCSGSRTGPFCGCWIIR